MFIFTTNDILVEGMDYVKSLCPWWIGLFIWYIGFYKKLLKIVI